MEKETFEEQAKKLTKEELEEIVSSVKSWKQQTGIYSQWSSTWLYPTSYKEANHLLERDDHSHLLPSREERSESTSDLTLKRLIRIRDNLGYFHRFIGKVEGLTIIAEDTLMPSDRDSFWNSGCDEKRVILGNGHSNTFITDKFAELYDNLLKEYGNSLSRDLHKFYSDLKKVRNYKENVLKRVLSALK